MHIKSSIRPLVFLFFIAIFAGCDAMDTILPSSNAYKINARVNGISLDECSFAVAGDKIYPYFEESVSSDPDITALLVFFKNSRGEIAGRKVLYSLNGEAEQDEILIPVKSLDADLPSVPMPQNFPVGRYTMVSQVMSGKDILQKTEKAFYYIGGAGFAYEGINVHLPGITDNPQIIPRGMTVLLEAKMNFDSNIDPYIIWYNGKKRISEGRFSEGADILLWKAPEQSGFYSISAEIFPSDGYLNLSGYQKEVSLLVSSKTMNLNLVSENIPQLMYWYIFDGNLNDSKQPVSSFSGAERSLKSLINAKPQWIPANGTYGLAAGYERIYSFPKVSSYDLWQTLFRFKPLNDGGIFYIQFSSDVYLNFYIESQYLVLTLSSPSKTVSQTLKLQEQNDFITAGVFFSVLPGMLSAKINISGDEQNELLIETIRLDVNIEDNFQIFLGHKRDENMSSGEHASLDKPVYTALWDEFAVYNAPPMETILLDVRRTGKSSVLEQNYIPSN